MATAFSLKGASSRVAVRPARASSVVVRASAEPVDRRAVLGAVAAAVAGAVAAPVEAKVLPWQESTGGMLSGGGSMTKSSTAASMEGYTLEGYPGTKKPSFIAPGEKKELRSRARELAMKEAAAAPPAPKKK